MLKKICKNLVWLALPLGLAVGCASNQPTTTAEAVYGPAPMLTPTSGEPEQRIYSADPNAVTTSINAAPPGASQQDWSVAEGIREKLTADPTLAPLGSSLITEIGKDGSVTLKGTVRTEGEKERVKDTISSVPGVGNINDELKVGRYHQGSGRLDTMSE
jgi:hypothetical protein